MIRTEWQKRRSDLNHGRLGNQFRTMLGTVVSVLEGKVRWARSTDNLVSECIEEWNNISQEASRLVDDFENEMSPRRCFDFHPLCNCDAETKMWLPRVVHQLWTRRYPVETWIGQAQGALAEADRACQELRVELGRIDFSDPEGVKTILVSATALQEACDNLVEKLSKFPHTVRV